MNYEAPVLPGYNPHLTDANAGMDWTPREELSFLRDLDHRENPSDPNMISMRDWLRVKGRLLKAIDSGYFVTVS